MATSIKISEIPAATSVAHDDYFPIVQDGITQTATFGQVVELATYNYKRVMEDDEEEIPYVDPARITICSIDPDGNDRVLVPSADFPAGSIILVRNMGPYSVTFSDGGSPAFVVDLGAGDKEFFIFDGTNWG
jgi:hypothetical protein